MIFSFNKYFKLKIGLDKSSQVNVISGCEVTIAKAVLLIKAS